MWMVQLDAKLNDFVRPAATDCFYLLLRTILSRTGCTLWRERRYPGWIIKDAYFGPTSPGAKPGEASCENFSLTRIFEWFRMRPKARICQDGHVMFNHVTSNSDNLLLKRWPCRPCMWFIGLIDSRTEQISLSSFSVMKHVACAQLRGAYEQGSKDAMKGFHYDPPSLLKICDLLRVAIGGLM